MQEGALHGIRVIDAATPRAELAGRVLAELGAEVIKVEPPEGAGARRLPPFERGREGDAEGSLYWAAVGLGKRSVVLDPLAAADRDRLRALLSDADVFIESFDPGTLEPLGLGPDALAELNPRLVHVSVTPFGVDGPDARIPTTELVIEAAGGLLGLQGDRDRPPIPAGLPQAAFHAGVQAAADTCIALFERLRSGRGQHLDVSMQAAVVWTLMNATGYPTATGADPPGSGEQRGDPPGELFPGLRMPGILPCADGWAILNFGLPIVGGRTLQAILSAAERDGVLAEPLRGRDWNLWVRDLRRGELEPDLMKGALDAAERFVAARTKRELLDFAVEQGILLAPVLDVDDLLDDAQLQARSYWQKVGGRTHAGPFARLSETPLRLERPAPALGEAQPLLDAPRVDAPPPARSTRAEGDGAFAGLRVADFAWVGVGPMISKALADHGATVVHVESASRPDVLRRLPPMKGEPGLDRSQFMANFNTSKLGLALDLSKDEGRELARRLADWADVVVESFTPGTMKKFGLDYDTLARGRPELVMLSTCMRGQTGPQSSYAGFGGQGAALSGLYAITGWPGRRPCGPWGAYTDFINPRFGVAALGAALIHRERTGRGQYVDLAQTEAGIRFLEPALLDYTVNGRVARARGAASEHACPSAAFKTAGQERYVAISVETSAQWSALCRLAPLSDFGSPDLDRLSARCEQRDTIEARLSEWCATHDAFELASELQRAGVPAYAVLRPMDLYENEQLTQRGFFVTLDHAEMGPTAYDGFVTRFSRTPGRLRAAPCLGQHTTQVLRDVLSLSDDEITRYAESGALA